MENGIHLVRLPANQAWAFVWGDSIVSMGAQCRHLFNTRDEAVYEARECGLTVDDRGVVR